MTTAIAPPQANAARIRRYRGRRQEQGYQRLDVMVPAALLQRLEIHRIRGETQSQLLMRVITVALVKARQEPGVMFTPFRVTGNER